MNITDENPNQGENPTANYSVEEIDEMYERIQNRSGNYLEELEIFYAAAIYGRNTLTAWERERLEYLNERSEDLDLSDGDEYMTLYRRAHGE